MAEYAIAISKTAQKQLDKLTDNIAKPVIEAIQQLVGDPRPAGCKKLKGRNGYRVRKGNYRCSNNPNKGIGFCHNESLAIPGPFFTNNKFKHWRGYGPLPEVYANFFSS